MAALKNAVTLYQQLNKEWNRKPPNVEKCGSILSKLKIALLELSFLPTSETKPNKRELIIARDILEIGVQWSVLKGDIESFQRYMAQLKPYYFDYRLVNYQWRNIFVDFRCMEELPESSYKYQLLGLNLLRLLAQNRLAEFHTELELLPTKEIQSNIYIKHPVSMEQYLMEGNYNKVFLAKGNVPAESYNFFIDILLLTIRDEIAGCAEKAYDKIAFNEAARILFFSKPQELNTYAEKRGWKTVDSHFVFTKEVKKTVDDIPSHSLALQAIEYARELEMIV
ncbi:26S proteasome non-ATPase regulatory subunit 8 [Holothuria leucospilota]|uniref:26S proteasome non-ATPase regulatory subunit 8 n=1 Tax=Holothuria leucospilota TaxID=206669 RepID=A0A9Q1CK98_HOLLE|nr:26S proteasome non-ATPase regulatory subunit 8 [Holothuria leucospilota]